MRTLRLLCLLLFTFSLLLIPNLCAQSTSPPPSCESDPAYHKLDFWVGKWDVFDSHDGTKGGTNTIEKILKGCAIVENWSESDGSGEGKSLFYYQRAKKQWKQVWVTDAGPMKEKALVEMKDGSVRFQGEIPHLDGTSHLDRTTLTPLPGDRVRQVIEISKDGGVKWEVTFDAEYRRQK